jgi:hypothetical protein
MSVGNEKKSTQFALRVTPNDKSKLWKLIKLKGFSRPSDFWNRCMETFISQVEAGQDLLWPLQFAQRIPSSARAKKSTPQKKITKKRSRVGK